MMDLLKRYQEAASVLDQLDFSQLFPGFRRYRFALYTDDAVCLDGRLLPGDPRFMGNTALLYEGEYIAIWNMGADPVEDRELLASSLVHEMVHCHQYTLGEKRFPSDLTMLNYPEDEENFVRKYRENCFLADACEFSDAASLERFAAIRSLRLEQYPEMVRQELKTETLEGLAEYIGLKVLSYINREKFDGKIAHYLGLLRGENELQLDIRRISYYTGTIYYLCMERLGHAVRNEMASELTVYEQNPIPAAREVTVQPCAGIGAALERLVRDRQQRIGEHIAKTPYTPCEAMICGYDPMNMFRVEQRIYCSHFVFLKIAGEMKLLQRQIVLELKDGSENEIIGYY